MMLAIAAALPDRYLSPVHLAREASAPLAVCRLLFALADDDGEVVSLIRHERTGPGGVGDEETMELRRLVIVVARRHLGFSFPAIGRAMNRDHSVVLRTFRGANARFQQDAEFRTRANRLLMKAGVA